MKSPNIKLRTQQCLSTVKAQVTEEHLSYQGIYFTLVVEKQIKDGDLNVGLACELLTSCTQAFFRIYPMNLSAFVKSLCLPLSLMLNQFNTSSKLVVTLELTGIMVMFSHWKQMTTGIEHKCQTQNQSVWCNSPLTCCDGSLVYNLSTCLKSDISGGSIVHAFKSVGCLL